MTLGKKIAIIGSPGTGKSTLAVELGERTGLPVLHLDEPYHNRSWPKDKIEKKEAWREYQKARVAKPEWIIDGNYKSTLDIRVHAADDVIYLDFSRWLCLWRIMKRRFHQMRGRKAAGANPEKADWAFLAYVWNFRAIERPKIMQLLKQKEDGVHILASPKELGDFVTSRRHH